MKDARPTETMSGGRVPEGQYPDCVFCHDPAHRHTWAVYGVIIGPCLDCGCPAWATDEPIDDEGGLAR